MCMVTRGHEEFRESFRKDLLKDIYTNARNVDSAILARNVDFEAVNKARLTMYGNQRRAVAKMVNSTEDANDMEKYREKVGGRYGADAVDFALEEEVEAIYFNYYGEGFDGGPVMDWPGKGYKCPCGIRFMMVAKSFPEECPKCRRLTPRGKLIRDGVMHR